MTLVTTPARSAGRFEASGPVEYPGITQRERVGADATMAGGTSPSDAVLVRRIADGDSEALGMFYDRYSRPLYFVVTRILGGPVDVDDVLQEIFLKIWKRAPSYDATLGKPINWALTVARHSAIDHLRRSRRRQACEVTSEGVEVTETVVVDFIEPARCDRAGHIRKAVAALPDSQRQCIELAFFGGLTHLEVADQLSEPLGTVKARIRRGMQRLKAKLAARDIVADATVASPSFRSWAAGSSRSRQPILAGA